ncbi:cytochrome c oxidase subunit II [Brevibacillus sp. SYSU BS000544]|uniref:cytochrome c oxidase subunit II n=1 Tax=Brevibacillus sp. SYSU BS000544 TaxID=3416443 RepID=UPI003CE4B8E1
MQHFWLPEALTQVAKDSDSLFYIILAITLFFFVLVELLLAVFLVRYRRKWAAKEGLNLHGNHRLEIIWTAIPALILVVLGVYSTQMTYAIQKTPSDVVVINVTGQKWSWEYEYPGGFKKTNDLRLPEGKDVLFKITSKDVIHSFWIPEFRMKQDAVPGRETQYSVKVEGQSKNENLRVVCAEYCGTAHTMMVNKITIMKADEFDAWVKSGGKAGASTGGALDGKTVAQENGCLNCHSVDGGQGVGPTWKGLAGSDRKLADGSTVKADDAYLTESIFKPGDKLAEGYGNVMQPYSSMSEEEAKALVEFIKTLK